MKALFIFGWMLLCSFSSAQVKIGGDPKIIHPHSLLELKSNTKALVLTVVTDLEMQAITPLNGALVFNIDQGCVFFLPPKVDAPMRVHPSNNTYSSKLPKYFGKQFFIYKQQWRTDPY